jgi:phage I-like protein
VTKHGRQMGYWTEVEGFKFFDDGGTTKSWIQAMTLGKYSHPIYGEIDITTQTLNDMLSNFKNNVRQTELDIDYDHKDFGDGKAAGWVKDMEIRGDGLWVLVEWTDVAAQALQRKEYKYFSPEFQDEWTHPKTGQTYKNVLFGGGITNRPFLRDIQPINMSEVFPGQPQSGDGVEEFLKLLREVLGLSDEADQDKLLSEIKALRAKPAPSIDPPAGSSIDEAELAKLAEKSPAVKALKEAYDRDQAERAEDRKRLMALEAAGTFRETEAGIAAACKLSEQFTIAPAHQEKLVKALSVAPKQFRENVIACLGEIVKEGIVELGERGRRRPSGTDPGKPSLSGDPVDAWDAAVAKLRETDKGLTYAEACVRLSADDPELWAEYADASYAGSIGSGD